MSLFRQRFMAVITSSGNLLTTSGLSISLHDVISIPDATSFDKCILLHDAISLPDATSYDKYTFEFLL